MKASELCRMIMSRCRDKDCEIEFWSYEWDDDLKGLSYHIRDFDSVDRKNGIIRIMVSR